MPMISKPTFRIAITKGVGVIGSVSGVIQNVGLNTRFTIASAMKASIKSVLGATKANITKSDRNTGTSSLPFNVWSLVIISRIIPHLDQEVSNKKTVTNHSLGYTLHTLKDNF